MFIPLSEWDRDGKLTSSKQGGGEQIASVLSNMIGGFSKNVQDKSIRRAAATMLGIDENTIPLGMFKQEDLVDLQKEKFKAGLDPEKKFSEMILGGLNKPSTQPAGTQPIVPEGSVMPGTQPAEPQQNALGLDLGMLLRGKISKKFGVPYEQMMTPEEKQQALQQKQSEVRASKLTEQDVKKEQLRKDLVSFFAIDDQINRGTGFKGRIGAGLSTTGKALSQSTAGGFAAAQHDAAVKRLRVQLVRAAGDVGNINIVEQKAAEQMLPTKFDAAGTAQLKRAYLIEIAKAIDDNSPNLVKETIQRFMNDEQSLYQGPKGEEANKFNDIDVLNRLGIDPNKYEIVR